MKIIAKKDLKKIICDKLNSADRYFTRVFNNAKFKYKDEVQQWLEIIRGNYKQKTLENLKL